MDVADRTAGQRALGAAPGGGGARLRVWAPVARTVTACSPGRPDVPLRRSDDGHHEGFAAGWEPGTRYGFRLDDDPAVYPDPASRFQPDGPHGLSAVVDPTFDWTDGGWTGLDPSRQALYEMHVGTFTPEGTFAAAADRLPYLADLGITAIEMMPVADFPGRFGWGYDGVNLFAPSRLYGTPDDLRRFVDRAHGLGLGVVLDVVYNHFGPDGNHIGRFSPDYFTDRYDNEWGRAINFDGPNAGPVRDFFLANVRHWIADHHMDGLRVDATQGIHDAGQPHILAEIVRTAREAAGTRRVFMVAENEPQDARMLRPPAEGGHGFDAAWNDDFHHSAMVALTGRAEAYYSDHRGRPQEFVSAVRHGYLFQGQRYAWQGKPRGTPTRGIPRSAFVNYLQNHDQIANQASPRRVHAVASPGALRALTALTLLAPGTPMLFQGQEFHAAAPFAYFADHGGELGEAVRKGRLEHIGQFASFADDAARAAVPDPTAIETFAACKLDWAGAHDSPALALHRDLLALRASDPALALGEVDGAVIEPDAFAIRFLDPGGDDRLLIVNLGGDVVAASIPEPLLAPPAGRTWEPRLSTEDPRYGGAGTAPVTGDDGWRIAGAAAVLLAATPA